MPIYPHQQKIDWVNPDGTAIVRQGMKEIQHIAFEIAGDQIETITGSFGGNEAEWTSKVVSVWELFTPWEKKQLKDAMRLYAKGKYGQMLARYGTDNINQIVRRFSENLRYKPREYQMHGFGKTVHTISGNATRFAGEDFTVP